MAILLKSGAVFQNGSTFFLVYMYFGKNNLFLLVLKKSLYCKYPRIASHGRESQAFQHHTDWAKIMSLLLATEKGGKCNYTVDAQYWSPLNNGELKSLKPRGCREKKGILDGLDSPKRYFWRHVLTAVTFCKFWLKIFNDLFESNLNNAAKFGQVKCHKKHHSQISLMEAFQK